MKKEKTIKTYQRRTKSGKVVTVKQHTAKYDAADKAKEMASKKGAGEELAAKKGMPDHNLPMNEYLAELKKMREKPEETPMEQETKKSSPSAEKKSKSVKSTKSTKNAATTQANSVSASDFKSWYHFNDWDKPKKSWPAEVRAADAAIRKQLGSKKAYDDYCSQIDGSYSKSGHNKAFKSFSGGVETSTSSKSSPKIKSEKISKVSDTPYSTATKKKWNATFLKAAAKAGIDEATVNKMGDTHGNLTDSSMRLFAGHSGAKKAYSEAKKEEKALYSSLTDSQKAFYRKYFDYDVSKESATKSKESKSAKAPRAGSPFSKAPVDTGSTKGNLKRAVAEGKITQAKADAIMGKSPVNKETSASLRKRADEMDAANKKATIEKKVGKGFRTIKNARLNSPGANTRTATLKGDLYIGKDGSAYYADPTNKGKLKKASERILALNKVGAKSKATSATSGTKSPKSGKFISQAETTKLINSAISKAKRTHQRDLSGLFEDSILSKVPKDKLKNLSPDRVWNALDAANMRYQKRRNKYDPSYRAEAYKLDNIVKYLKKGK